jgi:hypothetical protein
MDAVFYTLQEFMTYTKGMTYILMGVSLCVITAYWTFLGDRDDD